MEDSKIGLKMDYSFVEIIVYRYFVLVVKGYRVLICGRCKLFFFKIVDGCYL